jgi:hypothetical protein
MAIPGSNWAFFRVTFSGDTSEADFMLAEGQSRYGIELLAVNTPSGTVTIRKQGLTQTLFICQPPVLLATTDSATTSTLLPKDANSVAGGMASTPGGETHPADAPRFAHPVHAAGWGNNPRNGTADDSANNPVSADDASASSTSSAGTGSQTTQEQVYQWWTKEAQKIEQARLETAQRVLAGEWPPYPLTPLTPPGTPPTLIGPDSLFMEHGPGMIVSGH